MKITKYEHACVVLEEQGQKLVIDPGSWTTSLPDLSGVAAVVVTHVHADHFNPDHLAAIANTNPGVQIFGTEEVAESLAAPQVTVVQGGDTVSAGVFSLHFFGNRHATIHSSIPANQNVGVMVNDTFYYGGDSFTIPEGKAVTALAIPVSAPWLKMSEVIDYYDELRPRVCIPTHNAILSEIGMGLADTFIQRLADEHDGTYASLKPGQSLEF